MPSKYLIRNLHENSYYHIYNRGVENGNVFLDRQDYQTFLYYLRIYTASPDELKEAYPDLPVRLKTKNLSADIYLVAYVIMPNHFHILLKQKKASAMPHLMKQIINGYVTYFNKKYKKKGAVFSGRYKSVRIESEYLLVQMIRFVHLKPSGISDFKEYPWSSYFDNTLTHGMINRFNSKEEWEKFHLDKDDYEKNMEKIKNLLIDD